jgi:hypothetical protein
MTNLYRVALLLFLFVQFAFAESSYSRDSQDTKPNQPDTLAPAAPRVTPAQASEYLEGLFRQPELWREDGAPLKYSLHRLVDHFNQPFDSVRVHLTDYPFDAIVLEDGVIARHDTLPLRWLNDTLFIVDTLALTRSPLITRQTIVIRITEPPVLPRIDHILPEKEHPDTLVLPPDTLPPLRTDTIPEAHPDTIPAVHPDTVPALTPALETRTEVRDTITEVVIDTRYLESRGLQLYRVSEGVITPPLLPPGSHKTVELTADSSKAVFTETMQVIMGRQGSPFFIVPDRQLPDSLHMAVESLLHYAYQRDSILLHLYDLEGRKTPFWLSAGKDDMYRFWVYNNANDSISIWMGNPDRNALRMVLEDGVLIERPEIRVVEDITFTTATPSKTLVPLRRLEEIPIYWDFGFNNSFSLNQNYLSNWARGGESSLSSLLDVNARARYTNPSSKEQWTNTGRLRYGTTWTRERGYRTSTDIIELNSQYNRKMTEKLDFTTSLYAKSQVAKGFNYPNDSVPVSRFLNPGAITLGVGVEYKPIKDTRINFSPLSYRNTFVLDTANINQTNHGIDAGRRSRQEMGGQLVINNRFSILDGLNVSNTVRLFSNYLDKPQNVDVDWEMRLDKQISYNFTIRLNIHLIYDDDILFPVLDATGEPVLLPDGSPRKAPKVQFNQFLGLTLSLRI